MEYLITITIEHPGGESESDRVLDSFLREIPDASPVVDQAAQLQATYGNRMAFIHMEVYNANDPTKGYRPQLKAWRLPSEPWVFAIDRHGRVVDRLEGASSIDEMRTAIEKALKS